MSARDLMTLSVRLGGTLLIVLGLRDVGVVLWVVASSESARDSFVWPTVLFTGLQLVLGLLLARQSEWIVSRFAWPEDSSGSAPEEGEFARESRVLVLRAAGLMALLLAVEPAARLLAPLFEEKSREFEGMRWVAECVLLAAFATWALVRSARGRTTAA